jgi:hypothetical protein
MPVPDAPLLTFSSDVPDPFEDYLLDLFAQRYHLRTVRADRQAATVDLYRGNDPWRPCGIRIPLVAAYDEATLPRPVLREEGAPLAQPFPYDVLAACHFWLSDRANVGAPDSAFDAHERLRVADSAQARLGLRTRPPVNLYLQQLRDALVARRVMPYQPALGRDRDAIIVLSHDADVPIDHADPTHALWQAQRALRRGQPRRAALHGVSAALRAGRRVRRHDRRHWLFPEVMAAEAAHGFRSTFFFSARSRHEPGGTPFDESYDVRAPRFRQLFATLRAGGWEVSLHASYEARQSTARFRAEIARLEQASAGPVLGNRHHYWHMRRPFWETLEQHAAAGLRYDSSVAFNDGFGYRLGFAFPVRPWNPTTRRPIATIQVPTLLMDLADFRAPAYRVNDFIDGFAAALADLKQAEGVAAIDWHSREAIPVAGSDRRQGEAYLALLDHLAGERRVAVMPYRELLAFGDAGAAAAVARPPAGEERA